MNTASLLTIYSVLVIITETNCFYIQNTSYREDFERQAVILRKLQNLQERDSRNSTQTTTWSEILADVLVKEIFSIKKVEINKRKPPEGSKNVLVKTVSRVLEVYKMYIYDRLRSNYSEIKFNIGYTDEPVSKNRIEKSVTEVTPNPKDEVELIEPKYHGKLKKGNETLEVDVESECADGLVKDENKNCVESKHSKFVMSIPWQCPFGYRPDWLGYCRPSL